MGRLPYGTRNAHVNASYGADSNIMKFYCTQNGTTYGRSWQKFQPRKGKHTGTGYLSNFRPGVYYSQRLDELDNPAMGRIVAKNYLSITKKHFLPYAGADGKEPLPNSVHQVESGFIREKPITNPTSKEVKNTFIDTRIASAPANILPRAKPLLHKLQGKDPVEAEHGGFGPGFMTTETHEKFQGKPSVRMDVSRKTVGPNEETGFTHASNVEPITFQPNSPFKGDLPGWYTHRPTGISIMKTAFVPFEYAHGAEALPMIANRSDHDTGFTRGTKALPVYVNRVMSDAYDKASDMPSQRVNALKKKDPAEYMNAVHPDNYSSIHMNSFKGQQRPGLSESDQLDRTNVGTKEPSGYCENNDRYIPVPDSSKRFITHYSTRYWDKNPHGKEREGHCRGGVQKLLPDGFTKSTKVHSLGDEVNSTETLRNLEPYVARSIKARDPFFDDHLYDSKYHSGAQIPIPNITRQMTVA
ncbi:stabilizer of axonemal microtubules 4-like [Tubulanus polymorphus]|uniref:stabilizer of axonemal microtubules 4-like n=1 Tax=Tubulanus polymorphus TaxID=672921 RepID=UPI003DA368D7